MNDSITVERNMAQHLAGPSEKNNAQLFVTCCPNCLLDGYVLPERLGEMVVCPCCKSNFEMTVYDPGKHIKPESSFTIGEVQTLFQFAWSALDKLLNGPARKISPEESYISRMIELTRDDGIFTKDDSRALSDYADQLGLLKPVQQRLQLEGLRKLVQIFCGDGVLEDYEMRALESVAANGLVPHDSLKLFVDSMQKPRIKGTIKAGRLPLLPTDLIDQPKKNELLHWVGAFNMVTQTKTIIKYAGAVELLITSQRIIFQSRVQASKSITWEQLGEVGEHTIALQNGRLVSLLSLYKVGAAKPLFITDGDLVLARQIIKGIAQGTLKMDGIHSASH